MLRNDVSPEFYSRIYSPAFQGFFHDFIHLDSLIPSYNEYKKKIIQKRHILCSVGKRKDTVVNIEVTGEFVHNMATYDLREAVNKSAREVPPEEDEFEIAGVTKAPSELVKPVRVAESPVHFECKYYQTIRLPGDGPKGSVDIIIGRVVGIHINENFITPDGKLDIPKIRPLARMGYYDYTAVESVFEMEIPGMNKDLIDGLEGRTNKK